MSGHFPAYYYFELGLEKHHVLDLLGRNSERRVEWRAHLKLRGPEITASGRGPIPSNAIKNAFAALNAKKIISDELK